MASVTFNPDEVEENDFDVLPEGKYNVFIQNVTDEVSKKMKDMLKFELDIISSEDGNEKYKGRKLFYYLMLTESWTMTNIKSIMDSTGVKATQVDKSTFNHQRGMVNIKHKASEEYGTQANVNYWVKTDNTPSDIKDVMSVDSVDEDSMPF